MRTIENIAIIPVSDLTPAKGNHRMCLSAERATGFCYNCRYYENCESKIRSPELENLQDELDSINAKAEAKREEMRKAGAKPKWHKRV